MNSLRHFELRDQFGVLWIMNIDNRSSIGWIDMADIGIAVFHRHQSASWQVSPANLLDVLADAELRQSFLAHSVSPSYSLANSALLTDVDRGGQTQGNGIELTIGGRSADKSMRKKEKFSRNLRSQEYTGDELHRSNFGKNLIRHTRIKIF